MDFKGMGDLERAAYIIPLVIFAFFTINAGLRLSAEWKFSREHQCRKPQVASSGFLGIGRVASLVLAMKKCESLELMRSWHHQYGTTFKTSLARSVTITIEPKNVQAILALKFKDFDLGAPRNKAMAPLLGKGIFASDGLLWEHSRALIRPNFVRDQVADTDVYEKHVSNLIDNIPLDGSTVDLQELFFQMTMDSATEFLLGESIDSLSAGDKQPPFAKDFNTSQDGLAIRSRLGPLMIFYRDRAFSKATVEARRFVDQFVQKALDYRATYADGKDTAKAQGQQYVFIYELSKQTADRTVLTDQILNILLAGRDTTAGILSITFFILARRPDIWNKLREEVLTVRGERPCYEDLKSMTYLNWVLKETLRLYPAVPVNSRTANKNTYLPVGGGPDGTGPIFVPKGQEVIYSVYSMHRLPEVFGQDATEYRPERWASLKPGWAYIPFNGGPRICPGQQFALTEASYTIVQVLRRFKSIECRDGQPFKEGLNLTLASKNGTKVCLTPA
ncbi:cytochrome P450 [Penicillium cf. griseofulvum]|uniref:Cytochrome P450 n=1 Tax=Penicillium cf. griseofulvum TaxID=2972120 RepID=A0A9W9JP52_9EURO|nr:cytochrome P450 [Penicillium cf. griseofulvum]KAJ5424047.1 cytochrome P450 [Penicillium cf. griseofulvum]KAJ5442712.1 cytochrome P450 [Penicillium cf. griseofulvum]